jgi:putative oxidoreductase
MRRFLPYHPDAALLILRLVLGIIMIYHGYPKLTGFAGTAGFFASAGVPLPTLAAAFATVVEVFGGILIIIGVAADLAGLLFAIDMVGAMIFVHIKNGFATSSGGIEFPLALLAMALVVAFAGPGKFAPGRKSE